MNATATAPARCTALELLADRSSVSSKAADKRRSTQTPAEARNVCMRSYREGEAIAYTDAHKILKAELQRLRNLFQNGSLGLDDFEVPW